MASDVDCKRNEAIHIHTYIYEIYNALIVEDGSNQRRGYTQ